MLMSAIQMKKMMNDFFNSINKENKKIKIRKEAFIHLFSEPEKVSRDRDRRFQYQNIMKITETMVTQAQALEEIREFDFIALRQFIGVAGVLAFVILTRSRKRNLALSLQ